MAQEPEGEQWWRPVVSGLGALIAVSLAIGLVIGLIVLGATQLFGGDGDAPTAESPRRELPEVATSDEERTDLHLRPTPREPVSDDEAEETEPEVDEEAEEDEAEEEPEISLSASPMQAGAMQRIDLTGVYPGAEGVTVEVQRRVDGRWESFSGVTARVSGGTFGTWIQTGQAGPNRFRVYDPAADLASKPVTITIG